jgi:hypothetical protein
MSGVAARHPSCAGLGFSTWLQKYQTRHSDSEGSWVSSQINFVSTVSLDNTQIAQAGRRQAKEKFKELLKKTAVIFVPVNLPAHRSQPMCILVIVVTDCKRCRPCGRWSDDGHSPCAWKNGSWQLSAYLLTSATSYEPEKTAVGCPSTGACRAMRRCSRLQGGPSTEGCAGWRCAKAPRLVWSRSAYLCLTRLITALSGAFNCRFQVESVLCGLGRARVVAVPMVRQFA